MIRDPLGGDPSPRNVALGTAESTLSHSRQNADCDFPGQVTRGAQAAGSDTDRRRARALRQSQQEERVRGWEEGAPTWVHLPDPSGEASPTGWARGGFTRATPAWDLGGGGTPGVAHLRRGALLSRGPRDHAGRATPQPTHASRASAPACGLFARRGALPGTRRGLFG